MREQKYQLYDQWIKVGEKDIQRGLRAINIVLYGLLLAIPLLMVFIVFSPEGFGKKCFAIGILLLNYPVVIMVFLQTNSKYLPDEKLVGCYRWHEVLTKHDLTSFSSMLYKILEENRYQYMAVTERTGLHSIFDKRRMTIEINNGELYIFIFETFPHLVNILFKSISPVICCKSDIEMNKCVALITQEFQKLE